MMVTDVSSFIRINVFEVYYELYSFVSYLISLFSIFSGYTDGTGAIIFWSLFCLMDKTEYNTSQFNIISLF